MSPGNVDGPMRKALSPNVRVRREDHQLQFDDASSAHHVGEISLSRLWERSRAEQAKRVDLELVEERSRPRDAIPLETPSRWIAEAVVHRPVTEVAPAARTVDPSRGDGCQ